MPKPLTNLQRAFVREYVKDNNGKQAAIRAGYHPGSAKKRGSTLLATPNVAEALRKEQKRVSNRVDYEVDDHMRELEEIHAKAMEEQPIFNKEGNHVGNEWKTSAAALRAVELKGKVIGAYTEKVEHSGNPERPVQIIELPSNGRERKDE